MYTVFPEIGTREKNPGPNISGKKQLLYGYCRDSAFDAKDKARAKSEKKKT